VAATHAARVKNGETVKRGQGARGAERSPADPCVSGAQLLPPVRNIALFVDWKSTAHVLRPRGPRTSNWTEHPGVAAEILRRLRLALATIPLEGGVYYLDALLFGGFVGPDGNWTKQKQTLDHAIPAVMWSGIVSSALHLRQVTCVTSFRPGRLTERVQGLYRPSEPIQEAHLQVEPDGLCDCQWRGLTERWLGAAFGQKRTCPGCDASSSVPAVLAKQQQKLVDSLLISYAFDTALIYLLEQEVHSQVWICSADADFAPPLATISSWGIPCAWLQPHANTRFGYAAELRSLGVNVCTLEDFTGDEND
jgi:hypothetical protein